MNLETPYNNMLRVAFNNYTLEDISLNISTFIV